MYKKFQQGCLPFFFVLVFLASSPYTFAKNYEVSFNDTPSNGFCFYHAIASFMGGTSAQTLYQNLQDYLQASSSDPLGVSSSLDDALSNPVISSNCFELSQQVSESSFAGAGEVVAISQMLDTPILAIFLDDDFNILPESIMVSGGIVTSVNGVTAQSSLVAPEVQLVLIGDHWYSISVNISDSSTTEPIPLYQYLQGLSSALQPQQPTSSRAVSLSLSEGSQTILGSYRQLADISRHFTDQLSAVFSSHLSSAIPANDIVEIIELMEQYCSNLTHPHCFNSLCSALQIDSVDALEIVSNILQHVSYSSMTLRQLIRRGELECPQNRLSAINTIICSNQFTTISHHPEYNPTESAAAEGAVSISYSKEPCQMPMKRMDATHFILSTIYYAYLIHELLGITRGTSQDLANELTDLPSFIVGESKTVAGVQAQLDIRYAQLYSVVHRIGRHYFPQHWRTDFYRFIVITVSALVVFNSDNMTPRSGWK